MKFGEVLNIVLKSIGINGVNYLQSLSSLISDTPATYPSPIEFATALVGDDRVKFTFQQPLIKSWTTHLSEVEYSEVEEWAVNMTFSETSNFSVLV